MEAGNWFQNPGSTGLCGYVQPSHGCSNESVLEPVEKWNRATELRDICKYKTPFIVTVLQKCNFHRLVV
jgi:hypothetical protein